MKFAEALVHMEAGRTAISENGVLWRVKSGRFEYRNGAMSWHETKISYSLVAMGWMLTPMSDEQLADKWTAEATRLLMSEQTFGPSEQSVTRVVLLQCARELRERGGK